MAATPTVGIDSQAMATHSKTPLYVGLAFLIIAAVGLVAVVLAWWLRMRTRSRRRALERMTTWPWDHGRLGARQDSLEGGFGGLGIHDGAHTLAQWDPANTIVPAAAAEYAHGYRPDRDEKQFAIGADDDALASPLPYHAHARYPGGTFVDVPLHEHPGPGALHITNLAPGDVDVSRASTALGTYPSLQDPAALPAAADKDKDLAWAPLRMQKLRAAGARWAEGGADDAASLPYPGDRVADARDTKPDGWAASIRSNLFSALSAVVGGAADQPAGAGDTFTHAPARLTEKRNVREGDGVVVHTEVERFGSAPGYALEETADGRGVVHIHEGLPEMPCPTEDPFADVAGVPGTVHADDPHESDGSAEPTDSEVACPSAKHDDDNTSRVARHPPRLPSIPSISRDSSSTPTIATPGPAPAAPRKRTRRIRVRRPGLSRASTGSSERSSTSTDAGGDMSRASSTASSALTEAERFAKNALRERRRRVLEMARPAGKARGSVRGTTLSRDGRTKTRQSVRAGTEDALVEADEETPA